VKSLAKRERPVSLCPPLEYQLNLYLRAGHPPARARINATDKSHLGLFDPFDCRSGNQQSTIGNPQSAIGNVLGGSL
jgi:hypothetical protein